MLQLCETCNCRGFLGFQGEHGPCPTCQGSGFCNATSEQAREAEIAEGQGVIFELPTEEDRYSPYVRGLRQQVRDLADDLYDATA